jgi:uncharacterized lipoprotein YbaY
VVVGRVELPAGRDALAAVAEACAPAVPEEAAVPVRLTDVAEAEAPAAAGSVGFGGVDPAGRDVDG